MRLTQKSPVTGTGLQGLGLGSSGHEDSGVWPQAGGVHMLDGEGVLGGGSSVARSRGQLAGRQGQRWPGHSTRGNEGLSTQQWVHWETHPFKQDNCPCSWPPDIRSAFLQCHSLMASSFQNMQSPADLSNHEFHRVSSLGWSKHQDGFKASGHPIPPPPICTGRKELTKACC